MKSPLITLTDPEFAGGIGRGIVNLASEFISLGYRVHVVTDTLESPYFDYLHNEVGIFHLKTSHTIGGLPYFGAYLFRNRPDILVTPVVRHTILALRSKIMTGTSTKIYAGIHSTYSRAFQLLNAKKRSRRIKLLKKYYPLCEAVITVSKGVAEDFRILTGISPDRLITIHNPMTTDEISVLAREEVDHPWFGKDSPPVLLGVGRLTLAKNFPLFMEAFDIVRSKIPCRLMILGDGDLRETLEIRAASSLYRHDISLPGHKNNPFAFMSKAAVFVLSSSWEGFGNVLVEAMATGTPVVSTDCPHGPREILADGEYGPLVPPDNAEELAAAILDLLLNPTPRDLLIEGSERFNAKAKAIEYLEIFGLSNRGSNNIENAQSVTIG